MKELDSKTEYTDRKDLALSALRPNNILSSNGIYSVGRGAEGGKTKLDKFKEIIYKDSGVIISDDLAVSEMNKLLEAYRRIIKNKINICTNNMIS